MKMPRALWNVLGFFWEHNSLGRCSAKYMDISLLSATLALLVSVFALWSARTKRSLLRCSKLIVWCAVPVVEGRWYAVAWRVFVLNLVLVRLVKTTALSWADELKRTSDVIIHQLLNSGKIMCRKSTKICISNCTYCYRYYNVLLCTMYAELAYLLISRGYEFTIFVTTVFCNRDQPCVLILVVVLCFLFSALLFSRVTRMTYYSVNVYTQGISAGPSALMAEGI